MSKGVFKCSGCGTVRDEMYRPFPCIYCDHVEEKAKYVLPEEVLIPDTPPPAMSSQDQCRAFLKDLNTLVDRYRSEFDLTYPQVVGALHIKAADLCDEANKKDEDQ